jgi:hypothetical protein
MKTKTVKHPNHLPSIHVRVERFFRHRASLALVLSFMALGLVKYETHALAIVHEMYYGQGVGFLTNYAHHDEITRMPIDYGGKVKHALVSGE